MLWSLTHRTDFEFNILPDRNPLFVTLSDGGLRNGYTVKISNKLETARHFKIGSQVCKMLVCHTSASQPPIRSLTSIRLKFAR